MSAYTDGMNTISAKYGSVCMYVLFNPFPHDKILDQTKSKALADDKINVNKNFKFVLGRVENIVGKGEDAGYQHFLLFP